LFFYLVQSALFSKYFTAIEIFFATLVLLKVLLNEYYEKRYIFIHVLEDINLLYHESKLQF